jgi:predicted permease
VAIATVMLACAGLLARSFVNLRQIDLGFDPAGALTLDVEPLVGSHAEYLAAYDAILARVLSVPGVNAAGAVFLRPLAAGRIGLETGYIVEHQRPDHYEDWKDNPHLNFEAVTPGYFAAMRIPLRRGRLFSPQDREGAQGVAIVGESTARRLWPGQDPIGKRLNVASGRTADGRYPWQTVVGVVSDVRYRGLVDPRLDVYLPAAQVVPRVKHLVVRTPSDPLAIAPSIRAAIREVSPRAVIEYVTTMDRIVGQAVAPWRFAMVMFTTLAGFGVMLAAVGVFGLVAYAVAQRRRELAVRLALGASPRRVLHLVLSQGGRLAALGVAAGCAGTLVPARSMSALLVEVEPVDVGTFASAGALLFTVTLAASYVAARRVTGIDPLVALRDE